MLIPDQNRMTGSNEGKEYHPACIDKYQQICGPYTLGVPWELTKDNILTTPKAQDFNFYSSVEIIKLIMINKVFTI